MERLIFDTHAHYNSGTFDKNRVELLESLPQNGVALVVSCGTDYDTSVENLRLAQKYDWLYAAVGIHPTSLIEDDASTVVRYKGDWRAEMADIAPLYNEKKIVAVGEVGLDNHWPVPKDEQLAMFEAHIRLAMELDKPLIIHDREAHGDMYDLLRRYKPKGVLHSFSGSVEDVKWLCKQGIYFGFTGVVTFKNVKKPLEAAAAVPEELLLLETDCPYMAPEPYRGKTSNSAMIEKTAEKIAVARGVAAEALLRTTLQNGKRLFGIE